ncbi:MAG: hypothetical protein V2A66_05470 [Pseudomonadota bacterium]
MNKVRDVLYALLAASRKRADRALLTNDEFASKLEQNAAKLGSRPTRDEAISIARALASDGGDREKIAQVYAGASLEYRLTSFIAKNFPQLDAKIVGLAAEEALDGSFAVALPGSAASAASAGVAAQRIAGSKVWGQDEIEDFIGGAVFDNASALYNMPGDVLYRIAGASDRMGDRDISWDKFAENNRRSAGNIDDPFLRYPIGALNVLGGVVGRAAEVAGQLCNGIAYMTGIPSMLYGFSGGRIGEPPPQTGRGWGQLAGQDALLAAPAYFKLSKVEAPVAEAIQGTKAIQVETPAPVSYPGWARPGSYRGSIVVEEAPAIFSGGSEVSTGSAGMMMAPSGGSALSSSGLAVAQESRSVVCVDQFPKTNVSITPKPTGWELPPAISSVVTPPVATASNLPGLSWSFIGPALASVAAMPRVEEPIEAPGVPGHPFSMPGSITHPDVRVDDPLHEATGEVIGDKGSAQETIGDAPHAADDAMSAAWWNPFSWWRKRLEAGPKVEEKVEAPQTHAVEGPFAAEIDVYLDKKSRPSLTPPALIPPFSNISASGTPLPYPMRTLRALLTGSSSLQFEPASMTGPAPGDVRLISDEQLDHVLKMVPDVIRTAEPEFPPPLVYARFIDKRPASVGSSGWNFWFTHLCTAAIGGGKTTLRRSIVGEIGLFDDSRESLRDIEQLGLRIVGPETISAMTEYIRRFAKVNPIPPEIYHRIMKEAPRAGKLEFSTEEFELILNMQILRDVAATLWIALPPEMKARWMELFPLESTTETSGVYFRNLLYLHLEGLADDPEARNFFAQKTFADIMALYWNTEPAHIHRELDGNTINRFLHFITDVMKWAQDRRQKYGSAFAE